MEVHASATRLEGAVQEEGGLYVAVESDAYGQ